MAIYLDHAATSPLRPEVRAAMEPWLGGGANPSSAHAAGRRARAAVEQAREEVAGALGVAPLDVLFTSGGTEADNLAVLGLWRAARDAGRPGLVTTAVEHHAVAETVAWLGAHEGADVKVLPPGPDGAVDAEALLAAVGPSTGLVACVAVVGELGVVQPVGEVAAGLAALRSGGVEVPLHVDAVQAFAVVGAPAVGPGGATSVALSAHKLGGPGGVGVLALRRDVVVGTVSHGGGQERGLRSGTLSVPLVVGCGAAVTGAAARRTSHGARLTGLRDRLEALVCAVEGVRPTIPATVRAPHVLHLAVAGCDGEALLAALDAAGLEISMGSACQSGAERRSPLLDAVGLAPDEAPVRCSLGWTTTEEDVAAAAAVLARVVPRLRAAGGGAW